jgi:hypothetical protein
MKNERENSKDIHLRLPTSLMDKLERLAIEEDRSVSSAARRLLERATQPGDSLRHTWPPGAAT